PLADSVGEYLRLPQGRSYLVHVVSFGMTGAIASHGQTYSGFMQPWQQLSDQELADVLNHVVQHLNAALLPKDFSALTSVEVTKLRAKPLSMSQVRAEREALMKALAAAKPSNQSAR